MMRSLFSGVSGLKTHQIKMDVIGNNIANVNTTAYKASSMVFSDLMSQTTQRASGANATTGTGGVNARQIGLGVKSGAINVNIAGQGSSQSTGNPFDIMITGDNFFVVSNGNGNFFTRDGSFYVDGAGNLAMTSNGYNVMGWGVDEETGMIKQDTVAALRIMSAANMTFPPEATTQANLSGILDKFDTDVTSSNGKTVNLNFFDNLGYSYTARLTFKQSTETNKYSLEFTKLLDAKGDEVEMTDDQKRAILGGSIDDAGVVKATTMTQNKKTTIKLNNSYAWDGQNLKTVGDNQVAVYRYADGTYGVAAAQPADPAEAAANQNEALEIIAKAYGYEGSLNDFKSLIVDNAGVEENIATILANNGSLADVLGTEAESNGRTYNGYEIEFDTGSDHGNIKAVNGNEQSFLANLNLFDVGLGDNFANISIDLAKLSSVDNKGTSTANATSGSLDNGLGAGRRLGDMIGVSVQNNGMIYASYDNGMTKLLGQIATASFANASGLEKYGDNLYTSTLNSGEFDGIGVDVTANGGYMSTGQLEMSNVDLSSEFTSMITTQRGFQANSRIITVSDTLLEELTNLKR